MTPGATHRGGFGGFRSVKAAPPSTARANVPEVALPESQTPVVPAEPPPDVLETKPAVGGAQRTQTPAPLPSMPLDESEPELPRGLPQLQEIIPEGSDITSGKQTWLREFRSFSPVNRVAFEAVFKLGNDNKIRYCAAPPADSVRRVLDHYDDKIRHSLQVGFNREFLTSILDKVPFKILGGHYMNVYRAVRYAFGDRSQIFYSPTTKRTDEQREKIQAAMGGLNIEDGKPFPEVGLVLATALGTAYLVENVGRKLPYALRTVLKIAGAYPFFAHMMQGDMANAIESVKHGELDEPAHEMLMGGLGLLGIFMKKGFDALAAGTVMKSILSSIGHYQTDAIEQSTQITQRMKDNLPKTALVVEGKSWVEKPVEALVPGTTMIELHHGQAIPADVRLLEIMGGATSVNIHADRTRGQSEAYALGQNLDQGSIVLDDVVLRALVLKPASESSISKIVDAQQSFEPSELQTTVEKIGKYWVWGTLGGTVLVTAAALLRPLLGKKSMHLKDIVGKAAGFMTVAAPCNILVSTMIEGASSKSLSTEGVYALRGKALSKAGEISTYLMDFSGTCTMGDELVSADFYDADGKKVSGKECQEFFAAATLVGIQADGQHLKQKGMQRELFKVMEPAEAQRRAKFAVDATELPSLGVRGTIDGKRVRVGLGTFAFGDERPTPAQQSALDAASAQLGNQHTASYVRVGDHVGVLRFTDRLRPSARKCIEAIGADRVQIITGVTNAEWVYRYTDELGIDRKNVHTGVPMEEKLKHIERCQAQGKRVAMVCDGANDLMAASKADVTYALADNVNKGILKHVDFLVRDNLAAIAPMEQMAKKVSRTSQLTMGFAMLYTALISMGQASDKLKLPVIGAAFAHEGMSAAIAGLHLWLAKSFSKTFGEAQAALMA